MTPTYASDADGAWKFALTMYSKWMEEKRDSFILQHVWNAAPVS